MMRNAIALGLVAALALPACTTLDLYTGEEKTSKATYGAIIGAAAGAAIGSASSRKDRTQKAMIGAGIGALAGAAVGNYMDQQEAELRKRLQGTGVSVTRQGDNLILNMPGNITFDVDRDEVKASFYEVLNSVAIVLKKYDKTAILIAGHTDSTGTDSYNQQLSQRRAQSVGAYLQGQGIQAVRIDAVGYGESQPIASNDTAAGRAANRRVELTLVPLTTG